MLTDSIIDFARTFIEITLVVSTITSFFVAAAVQKSNILESKPFLDYINSLLGFVFGLLVALVWGLTVGPFDLAIISIIVWNATYLLFFLYTAWRKCSRD